MSSTKQRDRPRHESRVCHAIRLLAQGQTEADVIRAVRIRPATLAAWQSDEDFQALLACMRENGKLREAFAALNALTPDAIEALRRTLASDNDRVAVQTARDVLDRVGLIRRKGIAPDESSAKTITVRYLTPDGKPISISPWADRNPPASRTLQSRELRAPLREDGDG